MGRPALLQPKKSEFRISAVQTADQTHKDIAMLQLPNLMISVCVSSNGRINVSVALRGFLNFV